MTDIISVRGARLHNLKNINLDIPKNQLVVLTGVSGSGKSTLGFDILHKQGLRQYMEALGYLPFGFGQQPLISITGLPPSISLQQGRSNQNPRSTLGTSNGMYTHLRVLFARLGRRPCPYCGFEIGASGELSNSGLITNSLLEDEQSVNALSQGYWKPGDPGFDDLHEKEDDGVGTFLCPHCGRRVPWLSMAHFSFNKLAGACPHCTGLGYTLQPLLERLVDPQRSITDGAVFDWDAFHTQYHVQVLQAAARYYGFKFDPEQEVQAYPPQARDLLFFGVESPQFRAHYPDRKPPATVRGGRFEGVATRLLRLYSARVEDQDYIQKLGKYLHLQVCPQCHGARLNPESLAVTLRDQNIVEVAHMPVDHLNRWIEELKENLSTEELRIASDILLSLKERAAQLVDVGLGYLCIQRTAPSLSAGEAQRLRLACLLGSQLSGVLFVLDEPTVGMHPRDTGRVVKLLKDLVKRGNSVLVIEHELELVRQADTVIELGPGAGNRGGQVIVVGSLQAVIDHPGSITGAYLSGQSRVRLPQNRRLAGIEKLEIYGARHNNLKNLDVEIPLGLLVGVSGVSGAGKSSLIFEVIEPAARVHFEGANLQPGVYQAIRGWEHLRKVVTIDQQPARRVPRSNVATFSAIFEQIRVLYAAQDGAKQRGFKARHFSFNTPGGRCERCQGMGVLSVPMHFLPEVEVCCPLCKGKRYDSETLEVTYRGLNISHVLEMTVEEACQHFEGVGRISRRLGLLEKVGLGYLQLGQSAPSLSGGEMQRLKLARELGIKSKNAYSHEFQGTDRKLQDPGQDANGKEKLATTGRTLYLLDEPTVGLHSADIAHLLEVLQGLVEAGNSVLVVEHNLDVLKCVDWLIDLGPGAGAAGGYLVAQGTPEQVASCQASHTGKWLADVLHR